MSGKKYVRFGTVRQNNRRSGVELVTSRLTTGRGGCLNIKIGSFERERSTKSTN
jgi:hypothetical protein